MRETGKKKKKRGNPSFDNDDSESDWKDDFEFYLVQYNGTYR